MPTVCADAVQAGTATMPATWTEFAEVAVPSHLVPVPNRARVANPRGRDRVEEGAGGCARRTEPAVVIDEEVDLPCGRVQADILLRTEVRDHPDGQTGPGCGVDVGEAWSPGRAGIGGCRDRNREVGVRRPTGRGEIECRRCGTPVRGDRGRGRWGAGRQTGEGHMTPDAAHQGSADESGRRRTERASARIADPQWWNGVEGTG